MILSGNFGTVGSIAEIFGMLIAFAVIVAAAYYVSKYFGKYAVKSRENSNIRVVETSRVAPDRYLQIIEAGGRFFLIGISKNNLSLISELDKEQIKEFEPKEMLHFSFKEILDKAKSKEK